MSNLSKPAGYVYNTDILCPVCVLTALGAPNATTENDTEAILNLVSGIMLINRQDENSFDTSEFPKVILPLTEGADSNCDSCGEAL